MQHRSRSLKRPSRRRGVLMAWMIWIIIAAGLIAGGLFNVLWLSGVQSDSRRSAEASALAAGHEFLSDDLLRIRQAGFEHDGRIAKCRAAAIAMSLSYCRMATVPSLSEGDVSLTMPQSIISGQPLVPDAIDVRFDGEDDGYRVPLFFSGLTGVKSARVGAGARVAIEHAPTGFRPGSSVTVPILPLAILDDAVVSSAEAQAPRQGHWTKCVESGQGSDSFGWNPESKQFELGPDGIPEITVTVNSDGRAGDDACIPVNFAAGSADSNAVQAWVSRGLSVDDLNSLGISELSYPASLPVASVTPRSLSVLSSALQSCAGEPRIISLCTQSESTSPLTLQLTRPVAVRLVRVATSVGGNLRVTFQPCVLVTSTAVMAADPTGELNRYIYSVRLCD